MSEVARSSPFAVPVLRQDALLLLSGARVHELLAQVCSFRFASLQSSPHEAVMTQMIGLSIIAIALPHIRTPALPPEHL